MDVMTEITKRDWCGVRENVRALVNQEAPMRKMHAKNVPDYPDSPDPAFNVNIL